MTNDEIIKRISPYTICSDHRVNSTLNAIRHVTKNGIDGDIIECGVYRGGQIMGMMLALMDAGDFRDVYLYDTFEGMPPPEGWEKKNSPTTKNTALDRFKESQLTETTSDWCRETLDVVKKNVESIGYPADKVHFVKGMVEDTLPENTHTNIAVLRLDTDWYSSTKIELELLYPKLQVGGALLIDDYGHWSGAKKAVDEYLAIHAPDLVLTVDDETGRSAIKTRQEK